MASRAIKRDGSSTRLERVGQNWTKPRVYCRLASHLKHVVDPSARCQTTSGENCAYRPPGNDFRHRFVRRSVVPGSAPTSPTFYFLKWTILSVDAAGWTNVNAI